MPTLAVVAPDDRPVFEASFPQAPSGSIAVVEQLVLYSSLDMVDEKVTTKSDIHVTETFMSSPSSNTKTD